MEEVKELKTGVTYSFAAYFLWGILPLYWKLLNKIPAGEILAHRIIWSSIFILGLLIFQKRLPQLKEITKESKKMTWVILCTIFISINWFVFIWAVNSNRVVESSMGYYINPLVVVLLGVIVLKERLGLWQIVSLVLATIGVIIMTFSYGKIPWISLILAMSFGFYGLFKKLANVESILGLGLETFILAPISLVYIIYRQVSGLGSLGTISLNTTLILFCSGIATATPLLWFGQGAKRIPLSTLGFIQYLAPTISLIIGVFIFKEEFTTAHLISFGFIWLGLVIYSLSQTKAVKNMKFKRKLASK